MKNLAGNKQADTYIAEELAIAGIPSVKCQRSTGEVPCSIEGVINQWTFRRAWSYWVADAATGTGLPLDVAIQLHERPYPGGRFPTYGKVVRVNGDCSAPTPAGNATLYDIDGKTILVDPEGTQEELFNRFITEKRIESSELEKLRFVRGLNGLYVRSVIGSYHIDTQLGLNELVRVIKSL